MTEKKRTDVRAVNPRYAGMRLSDAVRVLTRPRSPAARAALEKLQGRSVTAEKVAEDPPAVKSAL